MKLATIFSLSVTLALCVLTGCVPSLHGIADRSNSEMDERLAGSWKRQVLRNNKSKTQGQWKFTPQKEKRSYHLEYTDAQGNIGEFSARLTKIADHHYLDLFPVRPHRLDEINAEDLSGFYRHHLLPIHTFLRIVQWEPTLKLAFFDIRKTDSYLEDNPTFLSHERTDVSGDLLITAPQEELRKFLSQAEPEKSLFSVPIVLKRQE